MTYESQIEGLLEEYRRQRERVGEVQRRIQEIAVTRSAPRSVVKVTTGAQGQVSAVEFPTSAYKRLPPKELAQILMATIEDAAAGSAEEFAALMAEEMAGLGSPAVLGDVGGDALPTEPELAEPIRRYVDAGERSGPGVDLGFTLPSWLQKAAS